MQVECAELEPILVMIPNHASPYHPLGKAELEAILVKVPNVLRWADVLVLLLPRVDGCVLWPLHSTPLPFFVLLFSALGRVGWA